jgi:hypothetical protein
MKQQNPVPNTCFVDSTGQLKSHEATIGGYNGVGGFASFIIVEVCKPLKVLPRAVESELPDVDIARPVLAT